MAGKVTRMSKIKQLLQLHRDGASNRSIARELGIYKGTVNDYVRKITQNNLDVNELLKLEVILVVLLHWRKQLMTLHR